MFNEVTVRRIICGPSYTESHLPLPAGEQLSLRATSLRCCLVFFSLWNSSNGCPWLKLRWGRFLACVLHKKWANCCWQVAGKKLRLAVCLEHFQTLVAGSGRRLCGMRQAEYEVEEEGYAGIAHMPLRYRELSCLRQVDMSLASWCRFWVGSGLILIAVAWKRSLFSSFFFSYLCESNKFYFNIWQKVSRKSFKAHVCNLCSASVQQSYHNCSLSKSCLLLLLILFTALSCLLWMTEPCLIPLVR